MIGRGLELVERGSEKFRTFGRQSSVLSIHSRELLRELRQVEEEVLRLAELRRRAVDPRARVDQVGRVELVPAVVALVAARLGKPQIGHVPSM